VKVCPTTGCPTLIPKTARYCTEHARDYEARRGTPTQRGYDQAHRTERARWQARIDRGDLVMCADGCGRRITGIAWHLGHTEDRTGYVGPQTIACNTADGGRRGADVTNSSR